MKCISDWDWPVGSFCGSINIAGSMSVGFRAIAVDAIIATVAQVQQCGKNGLLDKRSGQLGVRPHSGRHGWPDRFADPIGHSVGVLR